MKTKTLQRSSGILLHPTSLPSAYGIGDLGKEARAFIDFLEKSGQHLWQLLPLTHTGYGDSPYQSFSAFAGQPLLISPDHLVELELLEKSDLDDCPETAEEHVDYGTIIPWKTKLLKQAYQNFKKMDDDDELVCDYEAFCFKNAFWLDDYALFLTCKDLHSGKCWLEWDAKYQHDHS